MEANKDEVIQPNKDEIIQQLLQQNANLTLENAQFKSVLSQLLKEKGE